MDIGQIKYRNNQAGQHFFSPDTMRFFRSRVLDTVYEGKGGVYFVTSEQFVSSRGERAERKYTVRQFNPETSSCGTVREFNQLTRYMAIKSARLLSQGEAS